MTTNQGDLKSTIEHLTQLTSIFVELNSTFDKTPDTIVSQNLHEKMLRKLVISRLNIAESIEETTKRVKASLGLKSA
jgi:flagellin-specific chaperone FliS